MENCIAEVYTVRISGKPVTDYSVVTSKDASSAVLFAANELISYLYKTTGQKLELKSDDANRTDAEILVGQTNRREKIHP